MDSVLPLVPSPHPPFPPSVQGFFLALRLVAACQSGKEASLSTITLSDPPPRLAGVEVLPQNKWGIEVRGYPEP